MSKSEEAKFVVFEGLDGSGKTTCLGRVAKWLSERGTPAIITREPGGTPLGEELRDVFLDQRWGALDGTVEMLLMAACRRQHLLQVVEPALRSGMNVFCDRFSDSSVAYQGAGRGSNLAMIEDVNHWATMGRHPDLVIWFDLPAELALARSAKCTRIDHETLAFHQRVADGYESLFENEPERWFRIATDAYDERETFARVATRLRHLLV